MAMRAFTNEQMEAYGQVWGLTLGFATPFAVKAALKLGIYNIVSKLSSQNPQQGATLDEIVAELRTKHDTDGIQADRLSRLLRFLAFKKVLAFDSTTPARYRLTPISELLVTSDDDENSSFLGGLLSFCTSEVNQLSWQHIDAVIKRPGEANGFVEAHGMGPREYCQEHPEMMKVIEDFRTSLIPAALGALLQVSDGFKSVRKLVDVGGGSGSLAAELVKLFPHIDAVNFDLPQALEATPAYPGVKNVAGNAFDFVPSADAIIMKSFLHMFPDHDAAKLLKNCHAALEATGRVLILEMVMEEDKELHLLLDMLFLAGAQRYQRTQSGWKQVLASAGFASVRFHTAEPFSVIEAIREDV